MLTLDGISMSVPMLVVYVPTHVHSNKRLLVILNEDSFKDVKAEL